MTQPPTENGLPTFTEKQAESLRNLPDVPVFRGAPIPPGETKPTDDGEAEDSPHYGTNATECAHGVSLGEPCEQCEVPPH